MRIKKIFLTASEIVAIYEAEKGGLSNHAIAEKLGIRETQVNSCLNILPDYLARKNRGKVFATYKLAAGVIRKRSKTNGHAMPAQTPTQEHTPLVSRDRYNTLLQAYGTFEKAIKQFVSEEVEDKNRELIKENKQLKGEIEKMNEAFDEAKNANWVDNLKKQFGHN